MTPIGFKMVILDSFQPIKMKIFGFLLSMLNISMVVSGKTFNLSLTGFILEGWKTKVIEIGPIGVSHQTRISIEL